MMAHTYYKAYLLGDLRQYHWWSEKAPEQEQAFTDETVVYLRDDLVVVQNPILPDAAIIFDGINQEWTDFCASVLHFAVPEELTSPLELERVEA
jgi:hypothetical protein